MSSGGEFYETYPAPDSSFLLAVEDDGRVGYAYLIENEEIVGDLWLYNRAATPAKPEWSDPTLAPFLNPATFFDHRRVIQPLESAEDLDVRWYFKDGGVLDYVDLVAGDTIYARLSKGSKPGWNAAAYDGPLARTLRLTT